MTSTLLPEPLYQRCLDHLNRSYDFDFVVKDSIPIPYFGDIAAYISSPIRVATAALNPSDVEFRPQNGPRFDISAGLSGATGFEATLSRYFKENPYSKWFRSFEPILNGIGASYGGKIANGEYSSIALHLDICTPLATSPTWSRLNQKMREKLTDEGRQIFQALIKALRPDMIIGSVGIAHIKPLEGLFVEGGSWEEVAIFSTARSGAPLRAPLRVNKREMRPVGGYQPIFINGSAANTPFGRFSTERKREIGSILKKLLR